MRMPLSRRQLRSFREHDVDLSDCICIEDVYIRAADEASMTHVGEKLRPKGFDWSSGGRIVDKRSDRIREWHNVQPGAEPEPTPQHGELLPDAIPSPYGLKQRH